MDSERSPLISVVVPLYNAERFLEQGIACIRAQSFQDWELVAVDDGSTDRTKELLFQCTEGMAQPLRYQRQENGGGFAARNTGLDLARGRYIALFDIDDHWFPHHLQSLFEIMEQYREIDWLYAANQIYDLTSSRLVAESCFYDAEMNPKPFLQLRTRTLGKAKLIEDPRAVQFQLLHGLWVGQQFSLIRREVFEHYRFRASYRNEAADQVSVIAAVRRGFKLAYIEDIHGIYHIHSNNASAAAKGAPVEKYLRLRKALIRGFEEVRQEEKLVGGDARAVKRRIAQEYFWNIGFNLFLKRGHTREALKYFLLGLRRSPWDLRMWKTCLLALARRPKRTTAAA